MNLEVKNLCGGYGAELVLDGVEFRIEPGRIVTILGANGSGKSTLLKMIGRILSPRSGEILLDGRSIRQYDTVALARRLAILPQQHRPPGDLSVQELVTCGRFPHRRGLSRLTAHDRELVEEALRATRLEEFRNRPLSTLSGGERQRAWIAMTLAQEPELLLLDEPTTFLDICCQFEITGLIRRLNRERGITVLMVLHDLNLAAGCSDQLIMLRNHRIHCSGTPAEVLTSDNLRAVFGIESKIIQTDQGVPCCIATGSAREEVK